MHSTHASLMEVVDTSGIWNGEQRKTHAFQLSPNVFELSGQRKAELDELAVAINDCLAGISRIVAIGEQVDLCSSQSSYRLFIKALKAGLPHKLPTNRPKTLPILRKCDLLVGEDDKIWIAEIDATNPRSWGYSVLGRGISRCIAPDSPMLPGVAPYIARELKQRKTVEVTFLYGDTQRFYRPEFDIIAHELKEYGITMTPVNETEVRVKDGQLTHFRSGELLSHTLVDLPPMNQNGELISWLKQATITGEVQYLVAPKYFLAAKTMLGLLSNPEGDEDIESLLRSQISAGSLSTLRTHLPRTWIIGQTWTAPVLSPDTEYVLKRSVSSGMKNIFFSSEGSFEAAMTAASLEKNGANVLQEEIPNQPFVWETFDRNGRLGEAQTHFLRLTAYMSRQAVEDIAITACTSKRVHGGKSAIITGTVLV